MFIQIVNKGCMTDLTLSLAYSFNNAWALGPSPSKKSCTAFLVISCSCELCRPSKARRYLAHVSSSVGIGSLGSKCCLEKVRVVGGGSAIRRAQRLTPAFCLQHWAYILVWPWRIFRSPRDPRTWLIQSYNFRSDIVGLWNLNFLHKSTRTRSLAVLYRLKLNTLSYPSELLTELMFLVCMHGALGSIVINRVSVSLTVDMWQVNYVMIITPTLLFIQCIHYYVRIIDRRQLNIDSLFNVLSCE